MTPSGTTASPRSTPVRFSDFPSFSFVYHNPTRLHFGTDSTGQLASLIPKTARVLLLYGGGSIMKNGVYEQVRQALNGYDVTDFGGVEPNPTLETVVRARAVCHERKIDYILAAGGGSVIDSAKLLACAVHYSGDPWDMLIGKHTPTSALPIGVVLTLAATGSESNTAAVITRSQNHDKRVGYLPPARPAFAILNPQYMSSLPVRQLQNGLVDAFVHVCEQYLTFPIGGLVQDGYALALLETLYQLAQDFEQYKEPAWSQNLMWAANQALCGIVGVGMPQDWGTHRIAVELTALYGIDHARTLSIIQPALLEETSEAKQAKLQTVARRVFGLHGASTADAIEAIRALYRKLEMPTSLHEAGVSDPDAVQKVLAALEKKGNMDLGTHARLDRERITRIVQKACTVPQSA